MPEVDEHKAGHKFPFLVNEIFSLDNNKINEKFFSEEIIEEPDHSTNKHEGEDNSEDGTRSNEDDYKAKNKSSDEENEGE
jgi:hypothetical protein